MRWAKVFPLLSRHTNSGGWRPGVRCRLARAANLLRTHRSLGSISWMSGTDISRGAGVPR